MDNPDSCTPDDIVLEMCDIAKSFPGVQALRDVNFDVRRGEVHVLLGENGAGKSTLIKILSGAYHPDAGRILFKSQAVVFDNPGEARRAGISVIYQEPNLVQHLTVIENICLGAEPHLPGLPIIDQERAAASAQKSLDRLNLAIDPYARVEELNAAEKQMVEVARALHLSADLIVMDEPTASLSSREIAELFGVIRALRAQGVAVVYVSHRMEEVMQIGDRATVLRDGHKIATIKLADTCLDDLIQMIVGRYLPPEGKFARTAHEIGREVLRVEGLTRRGAIEDVSFTLHAGEVMGVAGLIGAGGTALVRMIFGADPRDGGAIYVQGQPVEIDSPQTAIAHGIGLLTENRHEQGLALDMSAQNNMTLAALENAWPGPLINHGAESDLALQYAERLGIHAENLPQKALFLSGGTQQKVVLSKWLATRSRVLIFDEPTRGIDVGARIEIYRLIDELAQQGVGIIIVSSDLSEIQSLCDRVLVLYQGRVAAELPHSAASRAAILAYAGGGGSS